MNRDDIIRMAEEAGGFVGEMPRGDAWLFTEDEHLERFAKLIAEHEREACAKMCEDIYDCGPENGCCPTYWNEALDRAAIAIRARGQA